MVHAVIATQVGGPIALVKNGDPIVIDASPDKRSIDVLIDEQEMERRKVGATAAISDRWIGQAQ